MVLIKNPEKPKKELCLSGTFIVPHITMAVEMGKGKLAADTLGFGICGLQPQANK